MDNGQLACFARLETENSVAVGVMSLHWTFVILSEAKELLIIEEN